ncbi:MAG: TlpA disulfide reductase family protein [Clostridia bacterium]|nr:TlpA disulfide reductase family protein [Clostridia bacterium]
MMRITAMLVVAALALCACGCSPGVVEPTPDTQGGEPTPEEQKGLFGDFSTTDLASGESVTGDILSDYDVTLIYMWETWCDVCVREMEELQTVYERLGANVNILGLCFNAERDEESALAMIEESGIEFMTLVGTYGLEDAASGFLTGYPAAVAVDSAGNVIGEPYVNMGFAIEDVAAEYEAIIANSLAAIGE